MEATLGFNIIDIEQGSDAWKQMRYDYITATDIASIFGDNKWQSRKKLLKFKAFKLQETFSDFKLELFKRGHAAEETARKILTDYKFKQMVLTSKEHPWLFASLDGFDLDDKNAILEAKYTQYPWTIINAQDGIIPKYHEWQIQTQLLISGANHCVYYITDGATYAQKIVNPDPYIWPKIIDESKIFLEEIKELRSGKSKHTINF